MDPDTLTRLVAKARSYGLHSCSYCQAVLIGLTTLALPDRTDNNPESRDGNEPKWGSPDSPFYHKLRLCKFEFSQEIVDEAQLKCPLFKVRKQSPRRDHDGTRHLSTPYVTIRLKPFVCVVSTTNLEFDIRLPKDPGTSGTLIHPRIKSDRTFFRARQLMTKCLSEHGGCKQTGLAPSRLLDVTLDKTRLVDTGSIKNPVWAALSYCWGGPQKSQTTYLNVHDRYREVLLEDLPLTIRDAVYVCREIDIPYLWVDSICIIQEDKNHNNGIGESDKDEELRKMAGIYSGAVLTIAASCASSADRGFLQDRQAYIPAIALPVCFNGTYDIAQLVPGPYDIMDWLEIEPIERRAWTLQEQLLSSRMLSFTEFAMEWHCKSEHCGISVDENHRLSIAAGWLDDYPVGDWIWLVMEYTYRDLSNLEDRPIAIAAVAQDLVARRPDLAASDYAAGLWKPNLLGELTWFTVTGDSKRDTLPRLQGPSWSWISIPEIIRYTEPRFYIEPTASVLSVDIDLANSDFVYGAVKSGRLRLKGLISRQTHRMLPPWQRAKRTNCACQVLSSDRLKTPPINVFLFELGTEHDPMEGERKVGLALQSTGEPGEFVRVGSYVEVVDKTCGGLCTSCREGVTQEEKIIEII
ncbi:hypothetical protein FG05_30511 [Fusarium graminearum]|uniref:Heterokaryon incompatibility domain-containing protein n=1 Tax=Gibberella zeae TaxID=5518 RepID=A0A4E9EES8_GIBZA|nr:hypothetical protein FG05_30511 [Fusarium graminearum]